MNRLNVVQDMLETMETSGQCVKSVQKLTIKTSEQCQ